LRFAAGGDDLDEGSQAYIAANAEGFREQLRAGDAIILVGHTDVSGSISSNRTLALQRAFAVRTAFERYGVFGMAAESAGEACSVANNESPEGRRRNRRVEIWVRPREAR
jgi:phosphate transport system substrate-binding protein